MNNKILYGLLGVLLLGVVGGLIWKGKGRQKGVRVIVGEVEKRDIQEIVAASGKIFPQKEVKISSDVSGEIVELYVQEGDSVTVGQLLAKIDPDAYQSQVERGVANVNSAKAQRSNSKAQIEQLKAQQKQIEAQLINAKEIYNRNKQLRAEGVVSEADLTASLSSLQSLEANLESAKASILAGQESVKAADFSVKGAEATLKELNTSLKRTKIYAPVSGIVSKLNVEEGERVVGTIQMQGTELMRVANLHAMEVRVDVTENDIPRVSLNDEVEIEVDAYLNRKFKGRVSQIAHSSNNSSALTLTSDQVTNFEVRISMLPSSYADIITPNQQYPFRPGMSATVEIGTNKEKGVISVPIQAVTTRDNDDDDATANDELREMIFVVKGDTVALQEIKTGIQDAKYIVVKEGLNGDEEIVVGPYTQVSRKLEEGKKIQKMTEKEFYKKDK